MSRSKGRLTLPANPSLEQLREQAKERLVIIRTHAPDAQLSDAQFALARDYGFSGWRELKAEIDRRTGAESGLTGHYAYGEAGVSNNVFSVTASAEKLFLEPPGGVTTQIIPGPDGAFATPGLTIQYRFERDAAGKARALIIETDAGATVRAPRIDAEKAAQIRAARDQAAKAEWRARTAIEVSENVLERCVGSYANPPGEVMSFSRQGHTLFIEIAGNKIPLAAETDVDFFLALARMEVHFRLTGDVATSLVFRAMGVARIMSRVSAEAAASLNAAQVRRAAEQARPRQLGAPVPPDILARYAGRYRVENGFEMAIEVKEGRIFAQILGGAVAPAKAEIFPESQTSFFWTARAAQVSFFIDAEGKVDYGVLHQSGYLIPMGRIAEPPAQVAPAA